MTKESSLTRVQDYWLGRFQAMASPCEILMDVDDGRLARRLLDIARVEASRVERKFSRYREDSAVQRINRSAGRPVEVDEETSALLDYAAQCHDLSAGRFDVTSGVLRRVWQFDGSDRVPTPEAVAAILPSVGWHKVTWERPAITLPPGMEIDLGGIGKEYAVDRCARLIAEESGASVLVNFGGDLYVNAPRCNGRGWFVGVEDPASRLPLGDSGSSRHRLELQHGGVATSGDTRRYLVKDGVRYSHILDPITGWPVQGAPRSVTVAASTCTEAGLLATFAMLRGAEAESFLEGEGVQYWCVR
jgi:thiamine biosynthesis lipoprotein